MTVTRVMTPSGRQQTELGNPPGRPPGPTQHLVPVGPPPSYAGVPLSLIPPGTLETSPRGRRAPLPRVTRSPEIMTVGLPRLDSAFINPQAASPGIPWTQLLTNLFRLAQPTGVVPGTYAGILFNAYGQAISASNSGASFDSATLNNATINNVTITGSATAPTPPANDNSTAIATTAWVREQNYATEAYVASYVGGQGFATESYVNSQGFATEAFVLSQGFITEAPVDGHIYGRQNGAWVLVPGSP